MLLNRNADMNNSNFIHDPLPQAVYDSFNRFIYSKDRKLFAKLASKLKFCELASGVPGDIVELGVFKGSGLMAWLKANELTSVNQKKIYGFDIFDHEALVSEIETQDATLMRELFEKRGFKANGFDEILKDIVINAGFRNFQIIVGNVLETMPVFLQNNPGFRASIINFDLDTSEPTRFCLNQLWDRLVPGGVMIFDDYGVNEWTESDAVDAFIKTKSLPLNSTPYCAPSAYIVKK